MTKQTLQDPKYREKKERAQLLAASYDRIGWEERATAVRNCGESLQFERYISGALRLWRADFCRGRLCPMCAWRRTTKVFAQTSQIMDYVQQQDQDCMPVFLTLTVRSCSLQDLRSEIDRLQQSWNRLMSNKALKSRVKGWMRVLEVTVNHDEHSGERDTWSAHPHFHIIMLMPKSYFAKASGQYLTTADWVQKWRKAAQLNYDPICHIEAIKSTGDRKKEISEVAKYCVKDADYIIDGADDITDDIVEPLHLALAGRRLIAYGGLMKQARKDLHLSDVEGVDADLTDTIRDDIVEAVEVYRWSAGIGNYMQGNYGGE